MSSNTFNIPKPKDRKLFFSKQVDQSSIETLSKEIIEINESDSLLKKIYKVYNLDYNPEPIEIYIDSYGGYVYQILGLIGIIEKSEIPIHTICTGAAMSCGFMLLIHGHKRFCYKHGTPMYHQINSGTWGKVQDMKDDVEVAKKLQKKFEEMVVNKTKITKKKLKDVRKTKFDWYMDAKEALKLGVIDEII